MKDRILLKEIPARTFHSAVCTTYSINLYYLEQQVLPFLSSKGINYVSVLADSEMLSLQLEQYGQLSQSRKRYYSIQGIKSSGAFHSKLIFLAGPDSVLLLLGSGNLTSSGHGKNLEAWHPLFIESIDDPKTGFVLQAWNYLKFLHTGLGTAAQNKLKSIEKHCHVLSEGSHISTKHQYPISDNTSVSFISTQSNRSIFEQVIEIVGDEQIDTITIMSPFHDSKGRFIEALRMQFSPKQVRVLLQKNFGNAPNIDPLTSNVRFFEWSEVLQKNVPQAHFHAKNILLAGPQKEYLISGSANASIAAFGTTSVSSTNDECCVLYESSKLDFHELLELSFEVKPISVEDYAATHQPIESKSSINVRDAFIIFAELNGDFFSLTIDVQKPIKNAKLILFQAQGITAHSEEVSWDVGLHEEKYQIPNGLSVLSVQLIKDSQVLSNSQFVTDLQAFEGKNPSPQNQSLNQVRSLIETGDFTSLHIIDYYNTLSNSNTKSNKSSSNSKHEIGKEETDPTSEELIYMSYGEIQKRAKSISKTKYIRAHTQYAGIQVLDSINFYKKEAQKLALEEEIDEEETEDANNSEGSNKNGRKVRKNPIKKSKYNRNKRKTVKFFEQYISILEKKVSEPEATAPTLIDLSMYLLTMEVLLHLVDHTEQIILDNNSQEIESKHLLSLPYTKSQPSWTKYMLRCMGLFCIWLVKSKGFKEMQNVDYQLKLERFKEQALHTNIAILSITQLVNKTFDQPSLDSWIVQCLLNTRLIFNTNSANTIDAKEVISYIPQAIIEDLGNEYLIRRIKANGIHLLNTTPCSDPPQKGEYFLHPDLGYTIVAKVLINPPRTFLKLFSTGFDWDSDSENYWNKKVYSLTEKKWLKTKS